MAMKNIARAIVAVALIAAMSAESAMAGNDDRRGTAGATELLINPWARSSGWGNVNTACGRGIDAFYTNIAGLAFVTKTELAYSNTMFMGGKSGLVSGASINAFGLAQRVGEQGVVAAYVMAMSFGNIPIQTESSPEAGSNGTFSPTYMNINVAYAHSFTPSIHGGAVLKVISEATDNVTGTGVALDAGIQYVTGEEDQLKFGISLKNIGPAMSFSGTGLSFTTINDAGNNMTVEFRSAEMELPTCFNIGISYDFLFSQWDQRFTVAGNFTSNAFLKDNISAGLEYSLLKIFQARVGYVYQTDIFDDDNRTTALTGICAGATVQIPLSKKTGNTLALDYSYRSASPMKGTHTIGATIKL